MLHRWSGVTDASLDKHSGTLLITLFVRILLDRPSIPQAELGLVGRMLSEVAKWLLITADLVTRSASHRGSSVQETGRRTCEVPLWHGGKDAVGFKTWPSPVNSVGIAKSGTRGQSGFAAGGGSSFVSCGEEEEEEEEEEEDDSNNIKQEHSFVAMQSYIQANFKNVPMIDSKNGRIVHPTVDSPEYPRIPKTRTNYKHNSAKMRI
ncbi:uncharacterized protein MYCFIDRAFT_175827 [Pseudocercospora fijiensis CIRAD86]|uniref:Uncharacterized protein n=1 Tax=Pseudocercospora fijiensis (strain CIRAD86) TaxID=383855 RepID=M3AYP3_PSEFD|nr:uncharacterized protein MYCFIDRAFT_175827 [Pseudocercospora fijiensis CIRAD86]EME82278.1 hypothetical protein MYCFIDRAFT_175827 [Pseudocercospora fijiensis CIRAD86]